MEEIKEKIDELIKNKRMTKLRNLLDDINSADFPALFEELNQEEIAIIYRLLPKEKAAEVFAELDPDIQERLINLLTDKELKSVVEDLFMDDTVDLIEEMPANVVKRILKTIKAKDSVVNTNTLIILLLKRFFNPFLSVRKIIINTKKEKESKILE